MTESPADLRSDTLGRPRAAAPQESTAPIRLAALDVLRGIAILGTLGTNIWILTHPRG